MIVTALKRIRSSILCSIFAKYSVLIGTSPLLIKKSITIVRLSCMLSCTHQRIVNSPLDDHLLLPELEIVTGRRMLDQ